MKIVFMGTPEFAVPSLEMLIKEGYDVTGVVTQPDKPKGRGHKLAAPPVKEKAMEFGIRVLQPESVRTDEFITELKNMNLDLLITAAYGKILPKAVLDIPSFGCINVHGSLLPKYRGAAPIQWSIINGDKITGITTMYTDVGMDTGDMLLKRELQITEEMTYGELYDEMAVLGAQVLKQTLEEIKKGTLKRIPQPHEQASKVPMMKKETALIDWAKSQQEIHNLVRGTNPWPVSFTFYKGKRMKIWKTRVEKEMNANDSIKPGTIVKITEDGMIVAAGKGYIRILELQFDSCRKMSIEECWHNVDVGEVLGEKY